jgi:hypothetical protein
MNLNTIEFDLENELGGSSAGRREAAREAAREPAAVAVAESAADADLPRAFKILAAPALPPLSKQNRAQLLVQSPGRLYFYWSFADDPFRRLGKALGRSTGYSLALKLENTVRGTEEIQPVETEGSWWFNAEPDAGYRAEIGFYAVNRPFIRLLRSNAVTTPRRGPSARTSEAAEWRIPSEKFARVLNAAGYRRDAFDVAIAGDDMHTAEAATRSAFAHFTGRIHEDLEGIAASEMRYALLALASGVQLQMLRAMISERLFDLLSQALGGREDRSQHRAMTAITREFEFDVDELEVEEEEESTGVFGGSVVNMPRRFRKRPSVTGPKPVGSHGMTF